MLYYRHSSSREHDPSVLSPDHPDTPERIAAVDSAMQELDWLGCELLDAPAATEASSSSSTLGRTCIESATCASAVAARSMPTPTSASLPTGPRCTPPAGRARWCARSSPATGAPASADCAPPATTPAASARWASACSTTSRSPPSWRSRSSAFSACSFSTGTSITATAPRRSSAAAPTSCTRASIRRRCFRAPARCRTWDRAVAWATRSTSRSPRAAATSCGCRCSSMS